jgi:hypothetical protein
LSPGRFWLTVACISTAMADTTVHRIRSAERNPGSRFVLRVWRRDWAEHGTGMHGTRGLHVHRIRPDNYAGGYKALAAEFRGKLDNELITEGIAILRDRFSRLDSIGPVWAVRVAQEAATGTGFDLEMQQRRAYEVVNALLREIQGMTQP